MKLNLQIRPKSFLNIKSIKDIFFSFQKLSWLGIYTCLSPKTCVVGWVCCYLFFLFIIILIYYLLFIIYWSNPIASKRKAWRESNLRYQEKKTPRRMKSQVRKAWAATEAISWVIHSTYDSSSSSLLLFLLLFFKSNQNRES